jgi:hypothetical protein
MRGLIFGGLFINVLLFSIYSKGQSKDSTLVLKSLFTLTNNGFAIVPAFSLGKPAFLFDLTIANKRFSFEPQFRYSVINSKPWIFNFNFRYKLLTNAKTNLMVGAYLPALNFVERSVELNGVLQTMQTVRRFLSGELLINQQITKKSTITLYYLHGHGFQNDGPRNINYLALRLAFQKIKLYKRLYAEFNPQLYYLIINESSGVYINETVLFGVRSFPIFISSTINKTVQSKINARDFDWNISVTYSFKRTYVIK